MTLDNSLRLVVDRLQRNRKFPKYQLERSIDGFLCLFLEEYLALHFASDVRYVAAEFPLKKEANNQSTNVDYLYVDQSSSSPAWIFVELKTDAASLRPDQLELYYRIAENKRMRHLLHAIEHEILPNSRRKEKYHYLLDIVGESSNEELFDAPIRIVCLTAHEPPAAIKEMYPAIHWVLLRDLADQLTHTKHLELWSYVKELVLSLGD